jgi:hypothetical protein
VEEEDEKEHSSKADQKDIIQKDKEKRYRKTVKKVLIMKPKHQTDLGSILKTSVLPYSDCFPELLEDVRMDKLRFKGFKEKNKSRSKRDIRLGWISSIIANL